MSFDRLQEKIDKLKNPTVVGLDPALEHIPPRMLESHIAANGETLEAAALAVCEWGAGLIDALCDIVPAVKPQSAFYEALGPYGALALKMTIDYAKSKGLYVILDGKRGDIGSTAQAYSAAYLGAVKVGGAELLPYGADALTINAYTGSDGIKPFIETAAKYDKAMFALVKTSNPSAGELQDLFIGAQDDSQDDSQGVARERPSCGASAAESPPTRSVPAYVAVGDLIESISIDTVGSYGYTRVGAVVGATYPEEMEFLRKRLKNTFFLVPGYGAQGGAASDAARAFDEKGRGAIVNSSRGIIAAWKKSGGDYAAAARAEALRMRDELRAAVY